MAAPKAVIMISDYGHDPTETAVPYWAMKDAGFDVKFATENGNRPECDKLMLEGLTQKLLGATLAVVEKYKEMSKSAEIESPLSWSAPDFTLDPFDLVLFPGGHDKGVRQLIDSPRVHELVLEHFEKTRKPSRKVVGAICHGVMALSESKDSNGISAISRCTTTTLPAGMERTVFWGTWAFLGDYYKTYGACSENTATSVQKALADPGQLKTSMSMAPFVIEDENYNYISARFPGDAELFSQKLVEMVQSLQ